MNSDKLKNLQEKVNDYRRFSFILISLSGFLFLGLVIPTGEKVGSEFTLIVSSLSLLVIAFACHRIAMKSRERLEEEQEG